MDHIGNLLIQLALLIIVGASVVTSLVTIYFWIQRRRQEQKVIKLLKKLKEYEDELRRGDQ